MAESPDQNVALFIDWDNLAISTAADMSGASPDVKRIVHKAQEYGRILVARAYAEWNTMSERLSVYRAGIEPVYAPTFRFESDPFTQAPRGKSLADPVMVTDCIDLLHIMPQIGTFVLVTGDKDLIPVVRLAQLRGRRVVVIGPDLVAAVLRDMADEYVSYRGLVQGDGATELPAGQPPAQRGREALAPAPRRQPARPVTSVKPAPPLAPVRPPSTPAFRPAAPVEEPVAPAEAEGPDLQSVYTSLVEILQQMAGTGRIRVRATNLKDQLLVRMPGFSERKFGFSKFKDLLIAAERSGLVTVSAAGPVHWVSLPSVEAEPAAAAEAPTLAPEPVSVAAAATARPDEAEQAARARLHRLAVVRYVDGLRDRSRWLTYTYVLTNVIGFLGKVVPPSHAEHEARSVLNYLVAEGALRIDKSPQEVDVGGIKHRVRMCHFVDEHELVREARAISLDDLPAELAAEIAPAAEATAPAGERAQAEEPAAPVEEPARESVELTPTDEAVAGMGGNGQLPTRVAEAAAAEAEAASEVVETASEAAEAGERSSRSRHRGGRRSRGGSRKGGAKQGEPGGEPGETVDATAPEAAESVTAETQATTPEPETAAVEPASRATDLPAPAEAPTSEREPATVSSEAAAAGDEVAAPTQAQVFAEVRRILEDLARQGKARVTGSSLKLRLGKVFPGFDERKFGYSKFRDFLQAAERDGVANLEMEGQVSWVRPASAPQPASDTPGAGTMEPATGEANESRAVEGAVATPAQDVVEGREDAE